MTIIRCDELTKSYGTFHALNKLSFTMEENKITGLIGRNGAGKTTLLKILAGYWRETSGDVKVFSESPFDNLTHTANTIFIDDQMKFSNSLTLKEILIQAEIFYEKWDMNLAISLFDYFSFHETSFHSGLSKGKKTTFNVIIGLASRCALTLLDEPTTGMDASVRKDFYRALLKDYIAHPRTIIISSHHLDEIEDLLEDVLLISEGRNHLHLPVEELQEYAIGLTGREVRMQELIDDNKILYKEVIGANILYIVVKNDFSKEVLERAKYDGIEISSVSSSDLCVYLTNKTKGGIDDVFNKN